jgi:Tfp pilus assembly protein PilF
MRDMIARAPAANPAVISTAYMTQAVALLGLNRPREADVLLDKALVVNPENSSAWYYRAAARAMIDDLEGSARMRRNAFQTNDSFENYAEVATLYFLLNWRGGAALIQSPFRNPAVIAHR